MRKKGKRREGMGEQEEKKRRKRGQEEERKKRNNSQKSAYSKHFHNILIPNNIQAEKLFF